LFTVIVATVLVVGCAAGEAEKQREGAKATAPQPAEPGKDGDKIKNKLVEVGKTARSSLKKEEVPKPPLVTEYYLLTEAYEAVGYRTEALKKKLEETATKGNAYVKLTKYDGLPEIANIYDDMGNHLNIVAYLWNDEFKVEGAVLKSAADRMLAMYLYCPGTTNMYVHDLSTFRVHAPFTRKLIYGETSLVVEFVDGHDLKGELPMWPKCEDVEEAQEKAEPYQSPFGVHREVYSFNADGNMTSYARYDLKGVLVEDIRGIAKKDVTWKDGRIAEESYFTADDLLARFLYVHDEKGRVKSISVVDSKGAPTLDYFGAAYYEYTRDKRGRVEQETRKDLQGAPYEIHQYTYAKFNQAEVHKVLDGDGTLQTTFVNTFNKKGTRLELAVYDGDPNAGKLKVDFNGVALYRYEYTLKGKLVKESRHGATQIVDKDGKQDYQLANGLDGWALIENAFDEEDAKKLLSTTYVRVDDNGNRVLDEFVNAEGRLQYRLERTFDNNVLLSYLKTVFDEQRMPTKKVYYDAGDTVLRVALLQYNADGLLMEIAYFLEDEKTPVLNPDGYHKAVKAYREDQKPQSETYFDANGMKVKTTLFEYAEDGKFKGRKHYDSEGKPIASN